MSGMDRLTDNSGYDAFAAYFRKNYPGPDTIIGNPDWHAPRLYRAALDAHRRASQAAPAPDDQFVTTLPQEAFDAFAKACDEAPAPSDGLREALERIAEQQMYRSGYDQTDISVEPVLTASEMQEIARAALSAPPAQEGIGRSSWSVPSAKGTRASTNALVIMR